MYSRLVSHAVRGLNVSISVVRFQKQLQKQLENSEGSFGLDDEHEYQMSAPKLTLTVFSVQIIGLEFMCVNQTSN